MLFNSYEFLFIFLPLTFFIYFYLNSKKLTTASIAFLVFASLVFYSYWNIIYLPLILSSMLFNFVIGNTLSKHTLKVNKKAFLTFGISANLLLLGYFKYTDFFLDNFNGIVGTHIPLPHIILPLGISFFTFTQIAYLVDCYKDKVKEYDFIRYALFVTYFPHLLAGPILHHSEMMPQFSSIRNKAKNYKNIAAGLFLFSIGLFKKVVIADTFALWANIGFDTATTLSFFEAWATSLSYTFQLYFDFSGYTDMAIGASLLFNIKLPINFNSPYKACDIQDFWRRWHMTLSRFLRDYIYIPLGGNRQGEFRTYVNLFATFLLGGLWHGAGWTFIFWGTLHGIALMLHRAWKSLGFTMNKYLAWFITFNFVNFAWIFFRAKEWTDAVKVISGMSWLGIEESYKRFLLVHHNIAKFSILFDNIQGGKSTFYWICFTFIFLMFRNSNEVQQNLRYSYRMLFYIIIVYYVSLLNLSNVSDFLYFNF
ncbi:MAG: MBOAT family protein [Sulfurospirillaceae bacterium]|nr:MBOAT family protein [Sulfurospirillaceae bacterium]MDD2826314.1 MBOAT family protein [Sulfurospirillaceae bacterium]